MSSLLIQYLWSAISLGLGCGSSCGSSIIFFLSTYIISHGQSIKRSIKIFVSFFLGKALATIILCVAASAIGRKFISEDGYIGSLNVNLIMQVGLLVIGVVLIINWILEKRRGSKCLGCKGNCSGNNKSSEKFKKWPSYLIGFIYGITPCAPLLLVMGYSVTLSIVESAILAFIFTLANSISPTLIMIVLVGMLSKKMYQEIPKWIDSIRLFCYIVFVVMAIVMLMQYLV